MDGGVVRREVGHCDTRLERDAEDYPALYPFGVELRDFLDADQETKAPFERRLRSVWRYIVGRVKRFSETMSPREAAILDCEDIANTIVAQLIEKDHFWDPSRGKYSTFVEKIIQNVLSTCHEQARCVSGPANSYGRLQDYRSRQAAGTLTHGMHHTMTSISRVMRDFASYGECEFWTAELLDDDDTRDQDPDGLDVREIRDALRRLDGPIQVWAVVRKYGLLGTEQMTFKQIAGTLKIKESHAKAMVKAAMEVLRRSLDDETL